MSSKKQTLGIVIGIVFVAAIMAVKFLAGNTFAHFLKEFLSNW